MLRNTLKQINNKMIWMLWLLQNMKTLCKNLSLILYRKIDGKIHPHGDVTMLYDAQGNLAEPGAPIDASASTGEMAQKFVTAVSGNKKAEKQNGKNKNGSSPAGGSGEKANNKGKVKGKGKSKQNKKGGQQQQQATGKGWHPHTHLQKWAYANSNSWRNNNNYQRHRDDGNQKTTNGELAQSKDSTTAIECGTVLGRGDAACTTH